MRMEEQTYIGAVFMFEDSAPWLAAEHAIPLTLLRKLARELDAGGNAAVAAQFGLTYRNLVKMAPPLAPEEDPVDGILEEAQNS